jgi:hypothetical protein
VSPQELKVGCAYYQVTYADRNLTIPGDKAMVYVGSNIFPEDDAASLTYYFQDTVSHALRGSVTDAAYDSKHPEIEAEVFPHTEHEVHAEVLTLADVIARLTEAQRRAEGRNP